MITDFQLMQIENFLLKNPDKQITIGDLNIVILNKKSYEKYVAKVDELIKNINSRLDTLIRRLGIKEVK